MLNDLFRTYKKIIISIVLLLSGIVFWFYGCHRQSRRSEQVTTWEKTTSQYSAGECYSFSSSELYGNVTFGTAGHLAQGRPGMVALSISSRKDKFSGIMRITLPGHDGEGIIYQGAISAKSGAVNNILLDVPVLAEPSCFFFEILDSFNNVQISEIVVPDWAQLSQLEENQNTRVCFLGVLSDHPGRLDYLDQVTVNTEAGDVMVRLIEFDKKTFPASAGYLASLSGILIDDFDTKTLRSSQVEAIRDFVETEEGFLMLAGGEGAKKVLSALSGWLQVLPEDSYQSEMTFLEGEENHHISSITVSDYSFRGKNRWGRLAVTSQGRLRACKMGKGMVFLSAFSFLDREFLQMSAREHVTQQLLKTLVVSDEEKMSRKEMENWAIEASLYSFLQTSYPNTFFYGAFFVVYIATIALIAYYVLRRMKKKEYIWAAVPALSILFTVVMGVHSLGIVGADDSSNSVFRMVDTSEIHNTVCLLYQNMEGEDRSISLSPRIQSATPMDYEFRYNTEVPERLLVSGQTMTINNASSGFDIEVASATPGNSWMLKMEEAREGKLSEGDLFYPEITAADDGFSGDIHNRTTRSFEKVVVIRGNQFAVGQSLDAGGTISIRKKDVRTWDRNENNETEFFGDEDSSVLLSVLSLVELRYFEGSNGEDRMTVIGISENPDETVFKDDSKVKNHLNMFVDHFLLPHPKKETYISNINTFCLRDPSADAKVAADTLENNKTTVTYQFDTDGRALRLTRNRDRFDGTISAYNYQTGRTETLLNRIGSTLDTDRLEPYISDSNQMTLTYKLSGKKKTGSAPVLSLVLEKGR